MPVGDNSYNASGRSNHRRYSIKKGVLKNSQQNTYARISFFRPATLLNKEALALTLFPVNFVKIKNAYFEEHLRTAACELLILFFSWYILLW